jgi:hypothetical protein
MQSNKSNDSQDHANDALAPDASFFDKPRNVKIILNSFYATCLVLVLLDFVVHRHIYLSFEEIPTFYALYGFGACVLLVVLAKLMRLVLMRGEHYYDERLDEYPQLDNEISVNTDSAEILPSEDGDQNMDELGLSSYSTSGDKK